MTSTLTSLLTRVRAASGPDRELDADICAYLYDGTRVSFSYNIQVREDPRGMLIETDKELGSPPHITASIDAAVALVERVLPGCSFTILRDWGGLNRCRIWTDDITPVPPYVGTAASLPLAILAALLSALEQKESAG